jgi:hypothetical protein
VSLPGATNLPLAKLQALAAGSPAELVELVAGRRLYVICRRGVDSVTATAALRGVLGDAWPDVRSGAESGRGLRGHPNPWHLPDRLMEALLYRLF